MPSSGKFTHGTVIFDSSSLCRERLTVARYTARGLIEVKDANNLKCWVHLDSARLWSSLNQ